MQAKNSEIDFVTKHTFLKNLSLVCPNKSFKRGKLPVVVEVVGPVVVVVIAVVLIDVLGFTVPLANKQKLLIS
jgi:hypothetical protein